MNNNKKIMALRLRQLFTKSKVKQKDLAKYLGVTDNTVSYYVTGSRMPNIEQIIKIAKYFDVTTDYILGVSDVAAANTDLQAICNYTGLNDSVIESLHDFKMHEDIRCLRMIEKIIFIFLMYESFRKGEK